MYTARLLLKLRALGVQSRWVTLFESWLRVRPAKVAVGGCYSAALMLHDMVFQGTVWGPMLWNIFFADVRQAVKDAGFEEIVFADDLNAYKESPKTTDDESLLKDARKCQDKVHKWGVPNRVTFDPKKESFHVLSLAAPAGTTFKTLGVQFDDGLTMEKAVKATATEAQWKLRTLERSSRFQCAKQMIILYKARVLSYIECRTAAVYHATDTAFQPLNKVQDQFLDRQGVPELDAFMEFNLPP